MSSPRSRGALSVAVSGLVMLAVSLLGIGVASAADDADSPEATPIISIEQTPLPYEGACNPVAQAQLTYVTSSTDDYFKIVITSITTPCTPIQAAAVAYQMPDNANYFENQWPQTLVERQNFTISEASDTTITFAKDCTPLQFDIITGGSPQVISPTGEWHGPLLFPGDTRTAEQSFPDPEQCVGPTTTTSSTTTTAVSPTSVTTTPSVAGVTTIAPSTSQPAVVAGTATTNPNAAALALTGRSSAPLAALGGLLLVAGLAMFAWSRRSQRD